MSFGTKSHGINIFIWMMKVYKKQLQHGKLMLALASRPLIIHYKYKSDSCAKDGAYLALISHSQRGGHHHAFLCPQKQHSDQMYPLKSQNLPCPWFTLFFRTTTRSLRSWSQCFFFFFFFQAKACSWGCKQIHRNKLTTCLLWESDLAYEYGPENN